MKLKKYICLLGIATMALTTACEDQSELITSVNYDRLFAPINLEARVVNQVNVRLTWTPVNGATSYDIEIFQNADQSSEDEEEDDSKVPSYDGTPIKTVSGITNSEIPYTITKLEGDTRYTARITAHGEGIADSKGSGIEFKTNAEQIFIAVDPEEIKATQVTLRWPAGEAADKIILTPGDIEHAVTADEIAAGAATITDLKDETEYTATLKKGDKTRGTITFTTLKDFGGATPVYKEDDFKTLLDNAEEGTEFIIVEGEFNIGDYELSKSVKIAGYKPSSKPTINGRFTVAGTISSLTLSNIIFDGKGETANILELTNSAANIENLSIEGCEIRNMAKHIIYNNKKGTFGSITVNNCIIDGIANDSGDGFDLRGGALTSLSVSNTTISNGIRSLVRCQVSAAVTFKNCTFYNICTIDDGNNTGLFRVEKSGSKLTVTDCLFANIGLSNPQNVNSGTWGRADKLKADEDFKGIYYFNSPNLWTNSHKDDYASFATEADPGFKDAANGDFTISNEDLIDKKAGDPRWY